MKKNKFNKAIILFNNYCKKQKINIIDMNEIAEFVDKNVYKISFNEIIEQISSKLDTKNKWEDKLLLDFIEFSLLEGFYKKIKIKRHFNPYENLNVEEIIKLNEYKRSKYVDFLVALENFDGHNIFLQNLLKIIK
ncbi:hypothetical protein [Mycoplasma anserisalpingitidis]|uniref:hypothetical protein n=1 Tax=Mycoplasma anserisalpingitidis TaxID=519450 RepID=UPI001CF69CF1|nr:hypothetical protein [Mycoplasma anserisalpingitidis]UCU27016.1 hypothetical protein K7D06_01640 [Mycoplasma anserisalpingitidis]UCU27143.1 hypothetical protein K9O38_02310 [Mycoplasma anserisalpingitidis]